jgi:hypothetical protein
MKGIHVCTISYVEEAIEAERRIRRGERQLHCDTCNRWVWPEECSHADRQTAKEYEALASAIGRHVRKHYPSVEQRLSKEFRDAVKRGDL